MSLTPEWRGRIDNWLNTMQTLFYVKLADVPLEGFTTLEQLSLDEAKKGNFSPIAPGTKWGAKWEYCWLRCKIKLPEEARGQRVVFAPDVDGESRVIINEREMGGFDRQHREILLSRDAVPDTEYEVLIESYAGHGPTPSGGGPSPDGVPKVPEPPPQQKKVGQPSFGIWQEDVFQLWIDATTLMQVRDLLDSNSLRVAEIDAALRDFTLIADLELPRDEMLKSVRAARERLRPVLECTNGSTAPRLFCFGHSHIDVAWLWPLAETERKCARTFGTQLTLMEEYPEFKFLQSQPHLFRMAQRCYPELYERIKAAAQDGQWLSEGGMWVEADTNITGGESLIRQFIHGKRFYKEEFGVDSELMWLPDVFGYSGAMPQIMAGCGVKYFSTHKIFWTYNGGDVFPYNTFWWEGIDGTRILSHIHTDYNSHTMPHNLMSRWRDRVQKDGIDARLVPFGMGDGGGGPTRQHLEFLRRQKNLEGMPRTLITSPIDYFKYEEKRKAALPTYVGELYYQCHRGTYTTQAKTKLGNRKGEFALREAELWGAAAAKLAGFTPPAAQLDEAWKGLLLNQFHDIIPGSSIHRVYEEAEALYAEVTKTARSAAQSAAVSLAKNAAKSVTVFNSLSWDRNVLLPLPDGTKGASVGANSLPVQEIDGKVLAEVSVPSCGWTTLSDAKPAAVENTLKASAELLENEHLSVTFNGKGEITSWFDKEAGREVAAGPMNSMRMYKDIPRSFDAWDIDSIYKLQPVELPEDAKIEVVAAGPLVARVRVQRKLNNSTLVQEITLRRGSRRVEFKTTVEWNEKHKMLKVNFPTTLHCDEAVNEIQFGHIRRPTHASRPFDADRFEVCNHKWTALAEENRGAAVLNDCKYGVNVEGGSINLTLLRSPQAPDMTADIGTQQFTYAFYTWNGSLYASNVVREGYELNVEPVAAAGDGGTRSLFSLDAPNVIIETVKPAEDGSGDVVVRLYEALRTATRCTLKTTLPVSDARETNMLEEGGTALKMTDGSISLDFKPFEIKTLRLK